MRTPIITTTFLVEGLDCPSEEKLIRGQLKNIPEIEKMDFNFITGEVTIQHQLKTIDILQQKIESLGMKVSPKDSTTEKKGSKTEYFSSWWLIGISGVLALFSELFSYTLNSDVSVWVVLLALTAMILSGPPTFQKGLRALRNKTMSINALMMIAITGAMVIGQWPEAAMVTVLFALAERIERYSLDRARLAIRSLLQLAPDEANVKTQDGTWQKLLVNDVALGAIIRVKPGERIPLDGVIVSGQSSVNQAPITGESMPVSKQKDDLVYAGTLNERGSFEVKVTKVVSDTLLAKIGKAIERAQAERAPTQRLIDQFAKYYTPLMVLIAIVIAIVPPFLFDSSFYEWFYKALTLLVIACPCALVISTPVTVVSGLAAAAKHGLLIKGGSYLETGHQLKIIALDKTGTLTEGKPIVTDFIVLDKTQKKEELLLLTASLDSHSEHPVAHALVEYWRQELPESNLLEVEKFEAIPGRGVIGVIKKEVYYVGNHQLAEVNQVCNMEIERVLNRLETEGKTTVILSNSTTALAIFAVADTLRATSQLAIQALHNRGIKTCMLTGDNQITAAAIAKSVGIDEVNANVLPTEKLNAITSLLRRYTHVGMVGDGINDAPALAKASISFAMGKGTDTALETADVALMNDDLLLLPFFIDLSHKTVRVLLQNISLSLVIKLIFFILALGGWATLWMAVFADMGASLIVVANGLRVLTFQNNPENE